MGKKMLKKAREFFLLFILFVFNAVWGYAQTPTECTANNGVYINGVCWAKTNVNTPNTFADNMEDAGLFYQWNSKTGWSSSGALTNTDGNAAWNTQWSGGYTSPTANDIWTVNNNVCPAGWRIPNIEDYQSLAQSGSIWTTVNGKNGRIFGNGVNTVFLPAPGYRISFDGKIRYDGNIFYEPPWGWYWTNSIFDATCTATPSVATLFGFNAAESSLNICTYRADAGPIRCVMESNVTTDVYRPLSFSYAACPAAEVTMGFEAQAGISYYWYNAETGGTLITPTPTNTLTVIKNSPNDTGVWWVEARQGATVFPRYKVELSNGICGETNPTGCAANGTVLFREDFGGNSPNHPDVSPTDLIGGRSELVFNGINPGSGNYGLRKYLYNNANHLIDDHTYPADTTRGYFMYLDPAPNQMDAILYEFDIMGLCSNVHLNFTAWMLDVQRYYAHPKVEMQIIDAQSNNVLVTSGVFTLPRENSGYIWRQFGFDVQLPNNVHDITFRIINKEINNIGNDWAIDDIEIRLCTPPVIIPNLPDSVCENTSVSIPATFTNDGTFAEPLEYQWFYSATGDLLSQASWTAVSGNTTNTLSINSFAAANEGYYRLAVAGAGNMNLENCRAMSEPFYLAMKNSILKTVTDTICANEIYNFYGTNINTQGTHTARVAGIDCDSIVTLHLTINPTYNNILNISICEGESYFFNGNSYNTTGTYTANEHTIQGCDSIVTLHLTINPTYNNTLNISICEGESYFFNENNYNTTGTYTANERTLQGCDSITTLHLTVYQPAATAISAAVEQGDAYAENGFNLPVQTEAGVFTHTLNLRTSHGCDSTVTLTLTVAKALKIDILPVDEICADDGSFKIFYNVAAGNPLYASVLFYGKAQQNGFLDIIQQSVNNQFITINLPDNVVPDNYSATVKFIGDILQQEYSYSVPFTVLYATSIMQQKWNDVIALKNSHYNGGYDFSAYQWYKNGVAIAGETASYLYLGNEIFDFVSNYQALLTRVSDGVTLLTCPFVPVPHTDITQFPTIVNAGENITVQFDDGGTATLYHISGFIVQQRTLAAGQNTISAPKNRGVYLLQMANKRASQVLRIVVR